MINLKEKTIDEAMRLVNHLEYEVAKSKKRLAVANKILKHLHDNESMLNCPLPIQEYTGALDTSRLSERVDYLLGMLLDLETDKE